MEGHGRFDAGKRAALRVLNGETGGPKHPLISDAEQEATSLWTLWRLAYDLPPTDPRVLDATEEDVVFDLLVRHFHRKNDSDEEQRLVDRLREHIEDLDEVVAVGEKIRAFPKPVVKPPAVFARRKKGVAP